MDHVTHRRCHAIFHITSVYPFLKDRKSLKHYLRFTLVDWFGKRGIPWHLRVATRRPCCEFEMFTFAHIFHSTSQDQQRGSRGDVLCNQSTKDNHAGAEDSLLSSRQGWVWSLRLHYGVFYNPWPPVAPGFFRSTRRQGCRWPEGGNNEVAHENPSERRQRYWDSSTNERCNPFVWWRTCRKRCLLWMCRSILRVISKARTHQSDKECSVRGKWFTGLEGVSTRPWKANSKEKLSIPSISQLLALTGVTRSSSFSFVPVKERRSKASEQDLPPTTTAAEVRSEGEESISKDRIWKEAVFRHFWGTHQCGDTPVRWKEALYSIKQLWGTHKNLKNNVKPILNSCSEQPPSTTDTLPQGWESFQESQIYR